MSIFDDNSIDRVGEAVYKEYFDNTNRLKNTGYIYKACVQSYNDLHSLDNVYNGMIATVHNEGYCPYVCVDGNWIKIV